MHKIAENGIITMTAGDSLLAPLYISYETPEGSEAYYTLEANDKVYFAILEPHQPFEAGLVRKIYTAENLNKYGCVIIELDATDTENLRKGTYYYEIKFSTVKNNKEYVDTIVPRRKLYII